MLGIYIHIPFCIKKCNYCDFNSKNGSKEEMESYKNAIIKEIESFEGGKADTVFIGGGTPSVLPYGFLDEILNAVYKKFEIKKDAEITMEANPATVKDFAPYKTMGINRLSIGLQSANDDELKILGRAHNFEDFLQTYNSAKKYFDNINIDTIFALPNQTMEKWENTLQNVVNLEPSHISAYSLIVEEGTPFYNMDLNLPSEDLEYELADFTVDFLEKKGYPRYEISNFGKECKHNLKYWNLEEYVGFGASAHSFLKNKRIENVYDIKKYIENPLVKKENLLNKDELMSEFCFLALRTVKGINIGAFNQKFNEDFDQKYNLDKFINLGFAEKKDNFFRLTKKGFHISNQIMCEFV